MSATSQANGSASAPRSRTRPHVVSSFAGVRRDLFVNLVGGEKDPASDYGKAVHHLAKRMRAMGFSNLVSKVYPETRHESLNEVNRDVVMDDFAAWADGVLKS